MKKLFWVFSFGVFVIVQSASATILIQDSFPTNGALVDSTPAVGGIWTLIGGTTPELTVSNGLLMIEGASSGQDAVSQFASSQTGSLFAGFDFTLTVSPTASTGGNYLLGFRDGTPASGTFEGRLFVRRLSGVPAGQYQIGISSATAGLDDPGAVLWGSALLLNSTYHIVLSFNTIGADATTLWVNPVTSGSTSVVSTDTVDVNTMDGFGVRQASGAHGTAGIDNLIVATTFDEVVPVPEPQKVALVAIGLGAFLFGGRRHRA